MTGKQKFLAATFSAIIFGVGLAQAGIELARQERPQVVDLFIQAPTERNLRDFEEDLEDASWFSQRLRPWLQYVQFKALKETGEYALLGRDDWVFYRPGVQYLIEPWSIEGPVDAIVSFRDQLAERGIHLLVLPMPGKASVYPEMLTRRARRAEPVVNSHTDNLKSRLVDAGVEMVDLQSVFADARARDEGKRLYLEQDTHWSPRGVRLAAAAVGQRILELGWVTKGDTAYDVKAVTVEREGDILQMMKAPRVARSFGAQTVACEQVVVPGTGEPYEEDKGSEIVVLGDSFLRIYQGDEPKAAGFIAHLARELAMPLASIVNDGGASTLVRQELSRRPALLAGKKVVVWEFVERDIRFGTEGWQQIALPKRASARVQ